VAIADARPGNTPGGAPDDAALPGAALLQQPGRLVEVLSSGVCNTPLREWLDPGARLVDSRVAIRRHVPGQRCVIEIEVVLATRPEGRASASTRSFEVGVAGGQARGELLSVTLVRVESSEDQCDPATGAPSHCNHSITMP
jgi:hypothetical protein